jgi:large subunit ribosomal protein L3
MAGHMGNKKVTIKNSEVLFINVEEKILVLKGSLPGKQNAMLKIQPKQ